MTVISRFQGIIIRMYLRQKEHNLPHIHAVYGEYIGIFSIRNGEMYERDMPLKCQQYVTDFIHFYQSELIDMWENQTYRPLPPIS